MQAEGTCRPALTQGEPWRRSYSGAFAPRYVYCQDQSCSAPGATSIAIKGSTATVRRIDHNTARTKGTSACIEIDAPVAPVTRNGPLGAVGPPGCGGS